MTVKHLLEGLDSSEVAHWMAHFELEHEERVQADLARQAEEGIEVARRRRPGRR